MFSKKSQFIVKFSFGIILSGLGLGLLLSYFSIPNNVNKNSSILEPLLIDISDLKEGDIDYYLWDNIAIGIYRRTQDEITYLLKFKTVVSDFLSDKQIKKKWLGNTFDKIKNKNTKSGWMRSKTRSIKPDVFVFIMISPIRGCTVVKTLYQRTTTRGIPMSGFKNYFLDPCTRQGFDLAGRIFRNNHFTTHLLIPNHRYIDENTIELIPNE